jgi:hypothetical protein
LFIGEFLQGMRGTGSHPLFRINCLYLVIIIILVSVADFASEDVAIVASAFIVYALIALIQVIDHVAILLRINEIKDVDDYKQRGEFLLLFFLAGGDLVSATKDKQHFLKAAGEFEKHDQSHSSRGL